MTLLLLNMKMNTEASLGSPGAGALWIKSSKLLRWDGGAKDEEAGVSILMSYGENPHYVKLPIFSEFMENSAKFMKNSGLTKWTKNLR